MKYNLSLTRMHLGLLLKFHKLRIKVLTGKESIKGIDGGLEPDIYVPEKHRLHDLIRGFYKPKGWKGVLSYMATEREDNYGKQIEWINKDLGQFKTIIAKPPSGENDKRATSDIAAARYSMENRIPIGILENQKVGINRCLGLGIITKEDENGNFIISPIEIEEGLLMDMFKQQIAKDRNYFSFRTNDSTLAHSILNGTDKFEFSSISNHYDLTKPNDVVFFVLGGDKPDWELGLRGICTVKKRPFDKGYDPAKPKYFKVELEMELLFPRPITREDMIPYKDCYDMNFIGPMTKGEPNQANSLLNNAQIPALIRAIIEIYPEFEEEIEDIFGREILEQAKSVTNILVYRSQENDTTQKLRENNLVYEVNTPKSPQIANIDVNIIPDEVPRNRILYGAPGTGKSYALNEDAERMFPHDIFKKRVTFYPRYSYSQFIGMYKPSPVYIETDKIVYKSDKVTTNEKKIEPLIEYTFVPGPFLEILIKAIKDPQHNYLIIIEEINRAEAATVFGDTFQLLDRNESGESQYGITFNQDVMNYLREQGIRNESIKFPRNIYIWATMNSADQGVLPMDAAFKRRWSFEYLPLNQNQNKIDDVYISLKFTNNPVKWNDFRNILNNKLKKISISEDKLIGPFFLSRKELTSDIAFKNKLLLYLRDDIVRHNPKEIFRDSTFSDIINRYESGDQIFKFNLEEELNINE